MATHTDFRITVDGEGRRRLFVDNHEVDEPTYIARYVAARNEYPPDFPDRRRVEKKAL